MICEGFITSGATFNSFFQHSVDSGSAEFKK